MTTADRSLNRQLIPLSIINESGGAVDGALRMHKYVFLLQREYDGVAMYEELARSHGPRMEKLNGDLGSLSSADLLKIREQTTELGNTYEQYVITDSGKRILDRTKLSEYPYTPSTVSDMVAEYEDVDTRGLLEYVFQTYPRMARNSSISLV